MKCIKCEGTVVSLPESGFHCSTCRSSFLDFGLIGGEGQKLDLSAHPHEDSGLHCPVDRTSLRRYRVNGVEFEHCPACRHVWLDRDEIRLLARRALEEKRLPADRGPDDPGLLSDASDAADLASFLFDLIGAIGDW